MLNSHLYLDQGFYQLYFYFQQHQSDFRFPHIFQLRISMIQSYIKHTLDTNKLKKKYA